MAIETPPPITPAPTPAPQRGERSTFSQRVDAFVTWLTTAVGQFAALALNVYNNAVEAYNAGQAATSQAAAAIAAVNATAWVSGTTYAIGNVRYSPINGQSYRRITAGAGTTDPSLDTVNWSPVVGMALTTSATISTNYPVVLSDKGRNLSCTGTITLSFSTAAALANGWYCYVQNNGNGVVTLDPNGAELVQTLSTITLNPGMAVLVASDGTGLRAFRFDHIGRDRVAVLASAGTLNLDGILADTIHVSGTTTITAITLAPGAKRTIVLDGALIIDSNASLIMPNNTPSYLPVGTAATFVGEAGGVVRCINVQSKQGYLLARDEKAVNTGGGTSVLGANTRSLTTASANTITGASVTSNQVTLPAGVYEFRGQATVEDGLQNFLYLYNVTDAVIVTRGPSVYSRPAQFTDNASTTSIASYPTVYGTITITTTKVFELRHYIAVTGASLGRQVGTAGGLSTSEIYATLEIWKIA